MYPKGVFLCVNVIYHCNNVLLAYQVIYYHIFQDLYKHSV